MSRLRRNTIGMSLVLYSIYDLFMNFHFPEPWSLETKFSCLSWMLSQRDLGYMLPCLWLDRLVLKAAMCPFEGTIFHHILVLGFCLLMCLPI